MGLEHEASLHLADTSGAVCAGDASEGSGTAGHARRREVGLVDDVVEVSTELELQVVPGDISWQAEARASIRGKEPTSFGV